MARTGFSMLIFGRFPITKAWKRLACGIAQWVGVLLPVEQGANLQVGATADSDLLELHFIAGQAGCWGNLISACGAVAG
jgi:hypothetical protein